MKLFYEAKYREVAVQMLTDGLNSTENNGAKLVRLGSDDYMKTLQGGKTPVKLIKVDFPVGTTAEVVIGVFML